MCVLLFDVLKHLLLRKTDVLKTCGKVHLLEKKFWRNVLALRSKKVQGIFGKMFILTLLSSAVFRLQNHVSGVFKIFFSGDKKLLSEFLRKWGWFQEYSELSPNVLAKN